MDASASRKTGGAAGAVAGTPRLLLMQWTGQGPAAGAGSLAVPRRRGRGAGVQTAGWTGGLPLRMLSHRAASSGVVGRRMVRPGGTGTAGSGGQRQTEAASVPTGEMTAGVLDASGSGSGRTGTGRSSRRVGAGLTGGSLIAQAAGGGMRRRRKGPGPGRAAAAAAVAAAAVTAVVVGGAGWCR